MHFNLKKAVGISVLPLLGAALAVGATALPASARTFQDTALQAFNLTQPTTTTAAVVNGVASGTGKGSTLTFTAPSGAAFASLVLSAGTTDVSISVNGTRTQLVFTSRGTGTGSAPLTFTVKSTATGVTCTAAETVMVSESGGTLGESAAPTSTTSETVTVSVLNNNTTGAVEFTGDVTPAGCTVTFSESNLPAGLVSGNPLVPGSAIPRTGRDSYDGVRYTATDPLGSTFTGGTFDLHVFGNEQHNRTFRDIALQAFNLTQPTTATGAVVNGVASGTGKGSTLTFTAPSGAAFASAQFSAGTTDATDVVNADSTQIALTSGGTGTGSGTLTFTIKSTATGVTCTAAETVMVSESGGTLGESAAPTSTTSETVTVKVFNNYITGAVEFTGDVTPAGCTVTFSESNLPAGLVSGNPLVPGSAIPRTGRDSYDGVRYTATDPLGSTFTGGTFDLHVFGYAVEHGCVLFWVCGPLAWDQAVRVGPRI